MGSKEKSYLHVTSFNPEVTGSFTLVDSSNEKQGPFGIDCGVFQERKYADLNDVDFPVDSEKIDFILITHNHADHIGKLPLLYKYGFKGKVYATKSTCELLRISLANSTKIMLEEAKLFKREPLYDREDVENVIKNLVPCNIGETIQVSKYIRVTYFDNGHIIGAAMILVQISFPGEEDINLFFTGDYKPYNVFKNVKPMPKWVYELPINVVTEATYGDTETKDIEYNFEKDVQMILEQEKSLFIPVLAQGRAQEILYLLKQMQNDGRISKSIPIFLDGDLSHQYTRIYQSGKLEIDDKKLDFLPDNFHLVNKDSRTAVMSLAKQKIILTTSGMLDHGPARLYLPGVLSNSKWAVFLTSYCSEGTLGRKLIDNEMKENSVSVMGMSVMVRAQIFFTMQFSSHAKADELEEFLSRFSKLKLVLINHGEKEIKEKFAERIEYAKIAKRVEVLGEYTIKLSQYGFIKAMGAKLYNVNSKKSIYKQKHSGAKKKKNFKKQNIRNAGKAKARRIVCRRKSSY